MTTLDRDLILVVDDDPETRMMLTRALDHAGFAVISAGDGTSALGLVEQARPSLVVLDAVMTGLSGFQTCRALKTGPAHATYR